MDFSGILSRVEKLSESAFSASNFAGSNVNTSNSNSELELLKNSFRGGELRAEAGNASCYIIENASSGFSRWFGLSVLEDFVRLSWDKISMDQKKHYQEFLFAYLSINHAIMERFVLNKLIKIQVDMGKRDWPSQYPSFFTRVHSLISDPISSGVGFEFLKIVCEEFVAPKNDLPLERKTSLKVSFTSELSSILQICSSYLDVCYEKIAIYPATATPRPSPMSKSHALESPIGVSIFKNPLLTSDFQAYSLPDQGGGFLPIKSGLSKSEESNCQCCMEIFLNLFSWINLADFLNEQILKCLLKFAHLIGKNPSSIAALSCINEIYNRKYTPKELSTFLSAIFNSLIEILKLILAPNDPRSSFTQIDEEYLLKLTDLIRLFFKNHLVRSIESGLSIEPLLDLFLKYTNAQIDPEGLASCIEIWKDLMVDVSSNSLLQPYSRIFGSVCLLVMQKIQMRENSHFLSEIDDSKANVEGFTEWDIFINQSSSLISKIAEVFPSDVLSVLDPILMKNMEAIMRSEFATLPNVTRLDGSSLILLRDIRVMLRIYGRICEVLFVNPKFNYEFNASADSFNEKLLLFGQLLLFKMKDFHNNSEVEQVMASSKSFIEWIKLCTQINSNYWTLYAALVEMSISFIKPNSNEKITLASSNLLFYLTLSIRTTEFITCSCISELVPVFPQIVPQIPESSKIPFMLAFANAYILNGDDSNRIVVIDGLKMLFAPLIVFPNIQKGCVLNENEKSSLKQTVSIIKMLAETVKEETTVLKKIVFEFLGQYMGSLLNLADSGFNDAELLGACLQTHVALFLSMKSQIGMDYIGKTTEVYFAIFGFNEIDALLAGVSTNSKCLSTLKGFFGYLTFLVEEPGKGFSVFTENIIDIIINRVFKSMSRYNMSEIFGVLSNFYKLLRSILTIKFNLFFPSSLRPDAVPPLASKFQPLMEILLFGLKQLDLDLLKQNLETLNFMQERYSLYSQVSFQRTMLSTFLDLFLEILLKKSHEILSDEIINGLFKLAQCDNFMYFNNHFLPAFLSQAPIPDDVKRRFSSAFCNCRDYPSFSMEIQTLVNDISFHLSEN